MLDPPVDQLTRPHLPQVHRRWRDPPPFVAHRSDRAADELHALYQGEGIAPDGGVIAYCRIGERSAHTWFMLHELLGYPSVENYDGSWTEYGSLVGVPVER